jgi:hypothetical protein
MVAMASHASGGLPYPASLDPLGLKNLDQVASIGPSMATVPALSRAWCCPWSLLIRLPRLGLWPGC